MKKNKTPCDLNTCMLCRLCRKEWLAAVGVHRTNWKVEKGETIIQEDEPIKGIHFVYDGAVKVHKHWGEDKELILRFAKKGNILGHRGLGKDFIYPISGTAIEPSVLCYVELDFFEASLKVNHDFLYELMQFFASELKESERNMRNLAHMPVKGRLAQALLALQEKFGTTDDGFINIALSRQDLASYVGTTYETVFRMLNEYMEEGLIRVQGKQIALNDPRMLNRL